MLQDISLPHMRLLDPNRRKFEINHYFKWINNNFVSPPKETDSFTQEEMIRNKYVGIYKKK